ncbi:AcrR family transcriptional regulator [Sphingomonas zeicaulis]|uniref:TetR/AcrR family transcriptional regulator n=1 Tax=Sphingomonas zeicaulis TaxID=1632740 RepID=UPI003D249B90
MRSLKGTPLALIEAAERLFGQHGIEPVSLRQIRLEACVGNNSAITYHFSDRAKLVSAIWEHRLPQLDAARRLLLDRIYDEGMARDPKAVLRALIIPNYDLMDASGVHRYAAFFRHALRWRQGELIRNAQLHATPAIQEALKLYYALRPDVSAALLNYRLRHASCMFFDMIFERDCAIADERAVMPEPIFLAEGIAMIEAACLRSPAG